ncbi:MAG TPA: TIGR04283 family arsenosugar biosynthesis glycosyltransferase [Ramlibacter sp.]|nr:TIGR04283 family arsenosugar biosynthesis glycosyltransferase [Ramlibacter sp.]
MTSLHVVLPVLQEAAGLPAALAALQPMRRRGTRVVVVDGGSTDATWALAPHGADEVKLAPRGRAAQMNAGAAAATADVLLFLHADTRLPPDADRGVLQAIDAGAAWGRFDVRIAGRSPLLRIVERLMNLRSRLTGIATGDQAIFVRRDVFERLGGFAAQPLMEDVALSARLRAVGPPACLRGPVVTSGRRWERHGVLRTVALMWRLRFAYWRGADSRELALRYGYAPAEPVPPFALAVLAKAPVPGLAKTRLAPLLGTVGAARAQRRFLLDTARMALEAAPGAVTVWAAPDEQHRCFRALRRRCGFTVLPQPAGDLGARLRHAMQAHFAASAGHWLVVGTDCPLLAPGHLQAAARALDQHDAVLVPAEDGGYVLLGLRRPLPAVFEAIDWSTPRVLAQTRERLAAAGASWQELPPLWDVDEPADWQRLHAVLAPAP